MHSHTTSDWSWGTLMKITLCVLTIVISTLFRVGAVRADDHPLTCDPNGVDANSICAKCSIDPSGLFNKLKAGEQISFICEHMRPKAYVVACWSGTMTSVGITSPHISNVQVGLQF